MWVAAKLHVFLIMAEIRLKPLHIVSMEANLWWTSDDRLLSAGINIVLPYARTTNRPSPSGNSIILWLWFVYWGSVTQEQRRFTKKKISSISSIKCVSILECQKTHIVFSIEYLKLLWPVTVTVTGFGFARDLHTALIAPNKFNGTVFWSKRSVGLANANVVCIGSDVIYNFG